MELSTPDGGHFVLRRVVGTMTHYIFLNIRLTMRMSRFVSVCLTSSLTGLPSSFSITSSFSPRHISLHRTTTKMSSTSVGLSDIGDNRMSNNDLTFWRNRIDLSIAKSRKIRGGNYVQIATVDSETKEPRCRTVVFRGFQDMSSSSNIVCNDKPCVMKMITDHRSNKVTEATTGNSSCEMVWWFGKSSEQYRIRGELKFVGNGQFELDDELASVRKQQWGNLSDMAREQFFWKEPGLAYSGESTVPEGGRDDDGKVLPPPDSFLLMLLFPNRVDYLRLGDNFRQIDQLKGEEWKTSRVNP